MPVYESTMTHMCTYTQPLWSGVLYTTISDSDVIVMSPYSQVADTVDGLLEELHYLHDQVEHADPIAANPDSLREQISENKVRIKLRWS